MSRLILAATLLVRALVAAADPFFAPSNDTQAAADNTNVTLVFNNRTHWPLVPLTSAAVSSIPRPYGIPGMIVLATEANVTNTFAGQIVCISCDVPPGLLNSNDVFQRAIDTHAAAVVFYTSSAQVCQPQTSSLSSAYPYVYSTSSAVDAQNITASLQNVALQTQRFTIVVTQDLNNVTSQQSDSGSTTSTAVAMIILYSVTGVITLLFLVIIVSGAIRAHRHPERYGPRNVLGIGRQSRAKGIARAMLDTIPIVKFSDSRPAKQIDVELGGTTSEAQTRTSNVTNHNEGKTTSTTERAVNGEEVSDGPGAQIVSVAPQHDDTEAPSCSICTEDFVEGEDLRVLPCDHRFHPACVDPWLLDVSGTCPLCRVDLRPPGSRSEDGNDENGQDSADNEQALPPPLDPEGGSRYRARLSTFFRRNPITTPDERIAALRRLREERRANAAGGQEAVDQSLEDQTRWQRVRHRLRIM